MQSETVSSVRTQVLERLGDGPITVAAGPMFDKNLWNVMRLQHINVTVLSETVNQLYKEGVLAMVEGVVRKTVALGSDAASEREAGIVQYTKRRQMQRTYALTDRGRQLLQRHIDSRNPQL